MGGGFVPLPRNRSRLQTRVPRNFHGALLHYENGEQQVRLSKDLFRLQAWLPFEIAWSLDFSVKRRADVRVPRRNSRSEPSFPSENAAELLLGIFHALLAHRAGQKQS